MTKGGYDRRRIGLPPRPFLYTPDQIGSILSIKTSLVLSAYLYYVGRSKGLKPANMMTARNIAPDPEMEPIWRVSEQEFIRWMQYKGFKFYDRNALYADKTEWNENIPVPERQMVLADSEGDPVDPEPDEGVGSP